MRIPVFAALVLLLPAGGAAAQSCNPGPICRNIDVKTQAQINGLPNTIGTNDSAAVSYCANLLTAHVAVMCMFEFQENGERSCAEAAFAQKNANVAAMDQAEAAYKQSSAYQGGKMPKCPPLLFE